MMSGSVGSDRLERMDLWPNDNAVPRVLTSEVKGVSVRAPEGHEAVEAVDPRLLNLEGEMFNPFAVEV